MTTALVPTETVQRLQRSPEEQQRAVKKAVRRALHMREKGHTVEDVRESILQGLSPFHRRAIEQSALGWKSARIAQFVGVSEQEIYRVQRYYMPRITALQAIISEVAPDEVLANIRKHMRQLAINHIEKYEQLLGDDNGHIRHKAHVDLWKHMGLSPAIEINANVTVTQKEYLASPKIAQLLRAMESGIIDVTPAEPPDDRLLEE